MVALRIVDATVSPSFGAIRMLANTNVGAVCMNARISRGLMGAFTSAVCSSVSMFVNAFRIYFAASLKAIVSIGY